MVHIKSNYIKTKYWKLRLKTLYLTAFKPTERNFFFVMCDNPFSPISLVQSTDILLICTHTPKPDKKTHRPYKHEYRVVIEPTASTVESQLFSYRTIRDVCLLVDSEKRKKHV